MNKLVSELQRNGQAAELWAWVQRWWMLIALVVALVALLPWRSR